MTATDDMALTACTDRHQQRSGQQPAQAVLDEPLFTIHEIARALRVSSATVTRRIRAGELEAIRVGREYRVTKSAWDTYFAGLVPTGVAIAPQGGSQ